MSDDAKNEKTAAGRMKPGQWLLRVLEGVLIGGGAILPGISGGVLCVSFGLYQPMMALLAHPKDSLRRYGRLFIPVGIGWVLGFWLFAILIDLLFGASDVVATWLFIGLIAGTVPSLFKEAARERKARGADWTALCVSFAVMTAFLVWVQVGSFQSIQPSIGWFFFCGVLWGLSLVVPGMTSSSILMSMSLYEPMVAGIRAVSAQVLLPMGAGIVLVVLLTARLVNYLFKKYYTTAYHAIIGIVLASTVVIIPLHYTGWMQIAVSAACAACGFFCALKMEAYGQKIQ